MKLYEHKNIYTSRLSNSNILMEKAIQYCVPLNNPSHAQNITFTHYVSQFLDDQMKS